MLIVVYSLNAESRKLVTAIESWFNLHEDGEFAVSPEDHKSEIIGDPRNARTIIYTTKRQCFDRVMRFLDCKPPLATIGRYGLPSWSDVNLLQAVEKKVTCIFVGDADPPDLMIYAWLNAHRPMIWRGVSDTLVEFYGNTQREIIRIPLSDAERLAVSSLSTFCPNFRELVGPRCSELLDAGVKIELESATFQS